MNARTAAEHQRRHQARCSHPLDKRHWRDEHGRMCFMRRDFAHARTWHCSDCGKLLPFGQAIGVYAEMLAFDFMMGRFDNTPGGFPSVAFNDGYRNYDERMQSWQHSADYYKDERHQREMGEHLDDYAAGAFALHLYTEDVR